MNPHHAQNCEQHEMPRVSCALPRDRFTEYVRHITNRRLEQISLPQQNPGAKNPFPWMSETMDLGKEKNFFKTRVTEYQSAANQS